MWNIKTRSIAIGLLLITASLCCQAAPKISVPQLKYEAKTVLQGTPLGFNIDIANKGDEVLHLTPVLGCNCGTILSYDASIKPHNNTVLRFRINTGDMQGTTSRTLLLHSNDPVQPTVLLVFKLNVKAPISIEPSSVTMNLTPATAAVKTFHVINTTQSAMVLGEPQGIPQYCTASIQGNSVVCRVSASAPLGQSRFTISIPIHKPHSGSISADVTLNVGIISEPASIYLGSYNPAVKKPMVSSTIFTSPRPFKITRVQYPKELKAVVKQINNKCWSVEVRLAGAIPKGVYRGIVTLSTDQPVQKKIELPVAAIRS